MFSQKQNKKSVAKLNYMKQTCLFMMLFIISIFSISPLHVRPRLPYIIKGDNRESLKTA